MCKIPSRGSVIRYLKRFLVGKCGGTVYTGNTVSSGRTTARLCLLMQKTISALISKMNVVIIIIIILLSLLPLTQCFPVTAGVRRSVQVFYCKIPRCAANVTDVFCNDKPVFSNNNIAECAGPPPPNTVCQQDSRAFVSTDTAGLCDFEGRAGYIETKKCTDDSDICRFISATTPSPDKDHATPGYIVGVVVGVAVVGGLILLIVGISWYFCKKGKGKRKQRATGDSGGTVPLNGGPGLDDGRSM
ncbi:uncharacterized protein LOC127376620 isoform X2 [Dicentrarchus labrax]|uniref:uncharacterized protein LOC127376620 isoform X2 n=1 Tax=Dicentrarchus labrax TaxID=13489 RepID=UPI0021F68C62|nr:uncharacterized protein LOC127376620 isoform X2 [Dicentrarchus labrax]